MNRFGIKSIFKDYNFCAIFKDAIIPLLASALLILLLLVFDSVDIKLIKEICYVSFTIIPVMLSLLIAGYAMMLTIYWSDAALKIRKYKESKVLDEVNASFAGTIITMCISLFIILFIYLLSLIKLEICFAFWRNLFNYLAFFIVIFSLMFSIFILKDTVINIFNFGQLSSYFNSEESEKEDDELNE